MEQLKTYLQTVGLNQREFAERVGVAESHLSNILSGKRNPGRAFIIATDRQTGGLVPASSWFKAEAGE